VVPGNIYQHLLEAFVTVYNLFTGTSTGTDWCSTTFLGERAHPSIYYTRLPEDNAVDTALPAGVVSVLNSARAIWTSCASPHSSGEFLLGTSSSVVHITDLPHETPQRHIRTFSDVFSCRFLPENHGVFVCGARDGAIRLFDMRVNTGDSREMARPEIRAYHGSAVTDIRTMSALDVLANGVGKCCMYDLRFPHPATPLAAFAEPTRAAVTYPAISRHQAQIPGLGFGVNAERGVIVVATQEKSLELYSVGTGKRLKWVGQDGRFKIPCKALSFHTTRPGDLESLFVANGESIDCYGW